MKIGKKSLNFVISHRDLSILPNLCFFFADTRKFSISLESLHFLTSPEKCGTRVEVMENIFAKSVGTLQLNLLFAVKC